jgi:outer membrane protein W
MDLSAVLMVSICRILAKMPFVASAALLLAPAAAAQDIYLKANIGYGFGTSASGLSTIDDDKIRNMSLGAGLEGGAGLGYYFTDNLAIELGVGYHVGRNLKSEQIEHSSRTFSSEFRGSGFQLTPSIVITTGRENAISPYARVGLLVRLMNRVKEVEKETYVISEATGSYSVIIEAETLHTGGIGLGGVAALGVDFIISDHLVLFGEAQLTSFAYSPTNGNLRAYRIGGTDRMNLLPDHRKSWEYTDNNNEVIPGENNKREAVKFPFSAIGVNLGVKFGF